MDRANPDLGAPPPYSLNGPQAGFRNPPPYSLVDPNTKYVLDPNPYHAGYDQPGVSPATQVQLGQGQQMTSVGPAYDSTQTEVPTAVPVDEVRVVGVIQHRRWEFYRWINMIKVVEVFFCLFPPTSAFALYFAFKAKGEYENGNTEQGDRYSKMAVIFTTATMVLFVVTLVVVIAVVFK